MKLSKVILENKKIILFPDNDEEGFKAMHHVAKILIENGITEDISIVDGHKGLEDGWDIADPINKYIKGITPLSLLEGAKEYIPDDGIWEKIEEEYSKRAAKEAASDFINKYVYVRDRKEFFEMESHKFVDKTQVNDWYFHITKNMSMMLLKDQELVKVHSYLTHAGLLPGVIEVKPKSMQFQKCKLGKLKSGVGVSGLETNAEIGSLSYKAPYSGKKVSK